MKNFNIITVLLLITISLNAQEMTIDQRISAISKASPKERVRMMNNLKRSIVNMNLEQRASAIAHLRMKMNAKKECQIRGEMRPSIQIQQMNHSQNMQDSQMMQQHKVDSINNLGSMSQNMDKIKKNPNFQRPQDGYHKRK